MGNRSRPNSNDPSSSSPNRRKRSPLEFDLDSPANPQRALDFQSPQIPSNPNPQTLVSQPLQQFPNPQTLVSQPLQQVPNPQTLVSQPLQQFRTPQTLAFQPQPKIWILKADGSPGDFNTNLGDLHPATVKALHSLASQFQQRQLLPPPPQQQQVRILKADGSAAEGSTRFEDLHPESQKVFLEINERIQQYKDESETVDRCERLYGTFGEEFDIEVERTTQEIRGLNKIFKEKKTDVQQMLSVTRDMETLEASISSNLSSASSYGLSSCYMGLPGTSFYRGLPMRPTPFLQNTVERFQNELRECRKWLDENEQLILMETFGPSSSFSSLPRAIQDTMSNIHELFVHVAGKVEKLHEMAESLKKNFLLGRQQQGQRGNPFFEADRQEAARQENAARRTLNFSSTREQPNPISGSFPNPAMLQQSVGSFLASFGCQYQMFSSPTPSVPAPGTPYFPPANPTAPMDSTSQSGFTQNPAMSGGASSSFAPISPAGSPLPFAIGAAESSRPGPASTRVSSRLRDRRRRR